MSIVPFLHSTYHLHDTSLVWSRETAPAFNYSDGDSESRLNCVFDAVKDLSNGSEELEPHMTDWPSRYHLSPARASLLRPIQHLLNKNVLEVGAGCGALTRFLGETAQQVVGIEGSARRAALARKRCRNQANVQVVQDNAMDFAADQKFEAVTLIGVLEYSRKYVQAEDPIGALLQHCRAQLTNDGALIVAIENQLGLKYFAGAPEDHLAEPYAGINDSYGAESVVTFGKKELTERLLAAGFADITFYYPFPDYKLPAVILSEAGAQNPHDVVNNLVTRLTADNHNFAYSRVFSEEMLTGVIARNGLVAELANSFLVVAKPRAVANAGSVATAHTGKTTSMDDNAADEAPLAWVYSTGRGRRFAKETLLMAGAAGLTVQRQRLYPQLAPQEHSLMQRICRREVIPGRLYSTRLVGLLNRRGWSPQHIADWAIPWVTYLEEHSVPSETAGLPNLPGTLLDCCPFNMVQMEDGRFETFDLEWLVDAPVPLVYVLMRGLFHCLLQVKSVATPAPETPTRLIELTVLAMELVGYPLNTAEVQSVWGLEKMFFRASDAVFHLQLQVRSSPLEHVKRPHQTQAVVAAQQLDPHAYKPTEYIGPGNLGHRPSQFGDTPTPN
jgi:2-polyprenyl-3-methyl-5-hydroxy-6-metoxy-1,4-benzoquinol methylase